MQEYFAGETQRNSAMFTKNVAKQPSSYERFKVYLGLQTSVQALPTVFTKAFDAYRGQGVIDFVAAYNAGYKLVVLKASEALSIDPMFDTNWRKATDAGLLVMSYHFFRSNVDGKSQADFHMHTTQSFADAIDYKHAVALDIETADGVTSISLRQTRAKGFWDEIALNQKLPGVYTSKNYWQTLMGNMVLPLNVWGWLAAWTNLVPALPIGWKEAQTRLWQYGVYNNYPWCEPVPGVTTDVDVNRWFGDIQSLYTFLEYQTTPSTSHSHLDYETQIAELNAKYTALNTRVTALEAARVYYLVTEDLANTYRVKDTNVALKPIMVPANDDPNKVQYHKGDRVQIIPVRVDADGSVNYWKIVGKELYLREQDGYVELY